jgi:prolyl oligopeptidase
MKKVILNLSCAAIFYVLPICLYAQLLNAQSSNTFPPIAPSKPATETHFGKQVTDPYRNLENLKDPAVLQWMKAQSDYVRSVLNSIQALSESINGLGLPTWS